MEENNAIQKEELKKVAGGEGGDINEKERRPSSRKCKECGSKKLEFVSSEYIPSLNTTISHYRCKDCGEDLEFIG